MVFSSIPFLFFFLPICLILYYAVPYRWKNSVLLFFSLIFYAWGEPVYILLMFFATAVDYCNGRLMERFDRNEGMRRLFLVCSVTVNLSVLAFFKYADFLIGTFNGIFSASIKPLGLGLPVGISFFTFQTMSYSIDLYRRKVPMERNYLDYLTYVSMFPQLVAGPIVRYESIEAEIVQRHVSLDDFYYGLQRFIAGLGKKLLIADVLAQPADLILQGGGAGQLTLAKAWLAAACYTLQIFFDFSGYSDMAIGLGRIFGFHFPENFLYPYKSVSVTEFWRRWHISLSSWFRDYLYIPMGGSRKGNVYLHLLIVFVCTGLWHGADYTFIVWGLWHGVFILIERVIKQKSIRINVPCALRWLYTMSVVMIGWVFFKADTLQDAIGCLAAMCGRKSGEFIQYNTAYYFDLKIFCVIAAGLCISFGIPKKAYEKTRHIKAVRLARDVFLLAVLFVSMITAVNGNYSPFIYFRF